MPPTQYQPTIPLRVPVLAADTSKSQDRVIIPIRNTADIVIARRSGRRMALASGASPAESTLIATIISELARNIVRYARDGKIVLAKMRKGAQRGITISSCDRGPGIKDVGRALTGGYSTSGGLGMGLSGVRRVSDEFHMDSGNGNGTTVIAKKWLAS
ncbi:MAG TPA: ATP-binding protein [Gammaproteobacteria bacterium]|nr:ATP-binding protein [Gammaproteobacteria bacterium]